MKKLIKKSQKNLDNTTLALVTGGTLTNLSTVTANPPAEIDPPDPDRVLLNFTLQR